MSTATEGSVSQDPFAPPPAESRLRFLRLLNPLAKIAAPLPAMVLLIFARDLVAPAAFLVVAYALILLGVRLRPRTALLLLAAVPLGVLVLSVTFGLWTDPERVRSTVEIVRIGEWAFTDGAWLTGLATALRLASIMLLAMIGGLSTDGQDLVRATVQQLRVPYRIGYTALAAFRFVPRFAHELALIRAAHRVRGIASGRGPIAALRRQTGYVVPLLAGAIRHAERVALSMDARAFGAHSRRTERHVVPFRSRDTVFVLLFWLVTAAVFVTTSGLPAAGAA